MQSCLRDEITVLPLDFQVVKRQPNGVPSHCMFRALKDVSEELSNAFFHIINNESCYTTKQGSQWETSKLSITKKIKNNRSAMQVIVAVVGRRVIIFYDHSGMTMYQYTALQHFTINGP